MNQNPLLTPNPKTIPLVFYIIASDIIALLVSIAGLFYSPINTVGSSLLCSGGQLQISTDQAFPPQVINCVQSSGTEEITYFALVFSFVFFSLVFGAISASWYIIKQKKPSNT